jgi:GMP synthase (glutamine-hydrolysing)
MDDATNHSTLRVLVLQHISCEPPGAFAEVLKERGAEVVPVELDQGEPLPDRRGFDHIIAMGGPMSVNDDESLPWLAVEKRFINEAVRSGMAFWGTCLGSQLLAASLGGRVYAGPRPEIGLLPVTLTKEARKDPLFRDMPEALTTLQWHGDTFDLPQGAVLLASSPLYPNQAFRWGERAYAVQFHLEVSVGMAKEWGEVPEYRDSLERTLGPGALERMIAELEREESAMIGIGRRLFERWLELPAPARIRTH